MNARGTIVALSLVGLSLGGCYASRASRIEANWGSAQRENTRSMLVNPGGTSTRVTPDDPTDGKSAQAAMEKHRAAETEQAPSAPPVSIINFGGSGG